MNMSLTPLERAVQVMQARCDRYEYIPNWIAAVRDITDLVKAAKSEALLNASKELDSRADQSTGHDAQLYRDIARMLLEASK